MSRKDEDRILHGLYYHGEAVDREINVTCDQVLWLAAHSFADAARWRKGSDGEPQAIDSSVVPAELRQKLLVSKYEVPLRYLQYRRLIKLNMSEAGAESVDVAVTFAGADRAMRLHTFWGRADMWYREHREGILGVAVTVGVSFVTAILAVALYEHVHKTVMDPPRILYEVDPKAVQ